MTPFHAKFWAYELTRRAPADSIDRLATALVDAQVDLKTRLMGAFISYLRLAHGIQNFFVLAPNLTIYRKLIADFTPNTPKYVFKGVAEFATDTPLLITGENYDQTLLDQLTSCRINIFNISKINSEVRGGKAPRIKRLSEYIGESYFEYLASRANTHAKKSWRYALIPEDVVDENMSLEYLLEQHA